jgi:phospholipase/carboxylesterase
MNLNNDDFITIGNKKSSKVCILWFHGYGSNNWSFEPTMKLINMRLNEVACIILPNAPIIDGKSSWYPLPARNNNGDLVEDYDGLSKSIEAIDNLIESLSLDQNKKFIVGGFSQGAALSLSLLFKSRHKIDGCAALSGYMPSANEFKEFSLKNNNIFIAHGYEDKAISYDDFKKTLAFLETKTDSLTEYTGDFGHTITHEVSESFIQWLQKI